MFEISLVQLIMWVIVGAVVGPPTAMLFTRSRSGYGRWINIALGMIGALLGGILFNLLRINIFSDIMISINDLIAAFVGSVIVIGLYLLFRRRLRK